MSSVGPTDVDYVATLVRQQGQELLKARRDLQDSKSLYATALDTVFTSKTRVEDALRISSRLQERMNTIRSELADLQAEHDASLDELQTACADLQAIVTLFHPDGEPDDAASPFRFQRNGTAAMTGTGVEGSLNGYMSPSEPSLFADTDTPTAVGGELTSGIIVEESAEKVNNIEDSDSWQSVARGSSRLEHPDDNSQSKSEVSNVAESNRSSWNVPSVISQATDESPISSPFLISSSTISAKPVETLVCQWPPSAETPSSTSTYVSAPSSTRSTSTPNPSLPAVNTTPPALNVSYAAVASTFNPTSSVSVPVPVPLSASASATSTSTIPRSPPHDNLPQLSSSARLSVASTKPVCTKLPQNDIRSIASTLCLAVLGSPEKSNYEIMKTPEVLLMDSTHASKKNQMYISVWKSVQSFNPGIRFQKHWKGHILVQDSMAKHLFYLGEYEGGGSCKLSSGEYRSLPKETKQVLFGLAKGLRQDDIYDLNDLFLSMRKDDGIFIVKTELRHVGYSSAIEKSLKQEAKKRGFV
ncbi:hypothetical protein F5878DRAFT_617657 [Lentinula raphanica]|uniref:Uncharacterized protein n=1 Tax=Lentinula raphanica TaxID=153919 RepID=A0AA38PAJ2_9AGAR|nr:hypothetical protein F5880DRAFT_1590454 [Lentinula raphanica]KAJ3839061.1 hypothetical protein F5878DRAFT_617657 [Lentinula raphanica]